MGSIKILLGSILTPGNGGQPIRRVRRRPGLFSMVRERRDTATIGDALIFFREKEASQPYGLEGT